MQLEGLEATQAALRDAQPEVKKATVPEIKEGARMIRDRAKATAQRHPSGLWRDAPAPSYSARKRGEFLYSVQSPASGPVARAEVMSEFAKTGWTSQGAALVRALDSIYGSRHGGRILWKARDDLEAEISANIERAAYEAAAKIEKEASTVG